MNLELNYNIRPLAHQSVKLTKTGHTYTPKNVKKYKAEIIKQTKLQLPKEFKIIESERPIFIEELHYIFKYPSNWRKHQKSKFTYRIASPDLLDNINKAFIDALEGVVFENDKNICSVRNLKKYYGENYGIRIKLLY